MKKNLLIILALTLTLLPACRGSRSNEVVKVTYVHKYGVPVSESDWNKQGRNGQVIEMTSDGVTASKSYVKGVMHGTTTYSFPNSSTIQRKEEYVEGKLFSRCAMYASGIPHYQESYEGPTRNVTFWYEQGTPQMNEQYHNDALVHGEYRNLMNDVESRVKDGEGTRLEFSSEGTVLAREKVENGEVVERVTLFANGEPSSIIPYQHGAIHGTKLTFSLGAMPVSVEEWANGFQEGITTLYQNGEIIAKIPYVKGKREGVAQLFRNGTDLVEEVTWKKDEMHGKRALFIEEGATKIEWYLHGELVNKLTFDRLNQI